MTSVLSLDGGGIRGVITAQILSDLQLHLPKPLWSYFDIITGSSTGAILALALASGKSELQAAELPNLYLKNGHRIFDKKWYRNGLTRPKYDGKGLRKVLSEKFGNMRMDDAKTKVVIPTYSVSAAQAVMFKSDNKEHGSVRMHDVATASASAPTFFPAKKIEVYGITHSLIDGGIVMNNPSLCGAAEAIADGAPCSEVRVLSIGTGEQVERMSHIQARSWGLAKWARPLVPVLFDGDSDAVDYIARHSFRQYERIQVTNLPDDLKAMDRYQNADSLRFYAYQHRNNIKRIAGYLQHWQNP